MKLDNLRLLVTSFEECFYFYRDTMGLTVTWGEPSGEYASFEDSVENTVAIFNRQLMAEALGKGELPSFSNSQDHFALIFRVEDLTEEVSRIRGNGGDVSDIRKQPSWGIESAYIRDPDGNLIELMSSMPKSSWDESLLKEDDRYSRQ
ncbi:VOC family protein [Alteribacter keqinensis]|uniref:VOC family protein n=1 Tax=Alteribacter keqinensis TaxID=2483800 RepID=A0A3M7TSI3_9BACI|nr:VOC family protein [Alteribacter keqinensis]RNA68598.1 VOC family protein [Alteribacter keqinensis]